MAEPVKRGDVWSVRIELPIDPKTGKRKRTRLTARTKRELEALVAKTRTNVQEGTYVQPDKQSFGAYLAYWLETHSGNLRATTLASYRQTVEKHIIPALGTVALQKLTAGQLQGYYAAKLASGRADGKGGLSSRTVRYHHTIIREALQAGMKWGYVARNVADATEPPRKSRPTVQAWNVDQLRAFLAVADDDHLYPAIWHVAATTGLRRGELLGLRWQDVDIERGTLHIRQTLVKTEDNQIIFNAPKTDAGRRVVRLDAETVAILRRQSVRQKEWRLMLGTGWSDTGLVFTTQDGKAIHPANLANRFKALCDRADVPRIRFHDLRHTHATIMLGLGQHPKMVSDRLGHSSIQITLDTYSHVLPDMQQGAADAFGAAVFGTIAS